MLMFRKLSLEYIFLVFSGVLCTMTMKAQELQWAMRFNGFDHPMALDAMVLEADSNENSYAVFKTEDSLLLEINNNTVHVNEQGDGIGVMKLKPTGEVEWAHVIINVQFLIDAKVNDRGDVAVLFNRGFQVSSYPPIYLNDTLSEVETYEDENLAILVFNKNGDLIRQFTIENDAYIYGHSNTGSGSPRTGGILIDNDRNIFVSAHCFGGGDIDPGPGFFDYNQSYMYTSGNSFLCKYDSNLNIVWAREFSGNNTQSGFRMRQTPNGDLLCSGYFYRNFWMYDDTNGWNYLYSSNSDEGSFAMGLDGNGNVNFFRSVPVDPDCDFYDIEADANGHIYHGVTTDFANDPFRPLPNPFTTRLVAMDSNGITLDDVEFSNTFPAATVCRFDVSGNKMHLTSDLTMDFYHFPGLELPAFQTISNGFQPMSVVGSYNLTPSGEMELIGVSAFKTNDHPDAHTWDIISQADAFTVIGAIDDATDLDLRYDSVQQASSIGQGSLFIAKYNDCVPAESPTLPQLTYALDCTDGTITIPVQGLLNDASSWCLYTQSGGGVPQACGTDTIFWENAYTGIFYIGGYGCHQFSTKSVMIEVIAESPTSFTIGMDTVTCDPNDSLSTQVTLASGFAYYAWSDGDSSQTRTFDSTGVYEVVVMDSLGCTYSDTLFVNNGLCLGTSQPEPLEWKLYPNPAVNQVVIQGVVKGTRYMIVNAQGRVIKQGVIMADSWPISLNDMQSGVYWIQLSDSAVRKPFIVLPR